MILRWVIFFVAGLVSTGCSDTIHPEFVAKRWSDTLRAFNIDPVFPPRHMQVGDVLMFLLPPGGKPTPDLYTRRALRLGRAEVRRKLMDDMQTDLLLPATGAKNPHINIFNVPNAIVSLHPTAYPGFNIAQVTEADLGLSFPVQIFRAIIGGAGGHDLAMTISIPQAEDSELPAYDAYQALVSFCAPNPIERRCTYGNPPSSQMRLFVDNLCRPGELPNTLLTPWIVFVNHVYYARQINYAYTTKGGAALGVSAALAATSSAASSTTEDSTKPSASGGTKSSPSGSATNSNNTSEHQTEAENEVQALQTRLDKIESQLGTTGGKLRVLTASSEGTLLSQTFNMPIAIGYRGLWFKAGPTGTYCNVPSEDPLHVSLSLPKEAVR